MATDASTGERPRGALRWLLRTAIPVTERQRVRRRITALCVPFLVLATVSGLFPIVEMVRISLSEAQFRTVGFSLGTYRTLLTDPYYRRVAVNSLWFAAATTVGSLGVAVPVAHALEKYDLPFERLLVTVLAFPNSLPGIVAAFMILVLLGNTGLVTNFLAVLAGRSPTDLATATSVVGLFFAYLYSMIPRALLLLRGTYAEVNTAAEEAARALGANSIETFYHVTLPQIRPGLTGAFVLTFRTGLAIFGTILILKSLTVWTLQINRELANGFDIRMASAMATVWFAVVFLFTVAALRYTSAEVSV